MPRARTLAQALYFWFLWFLATLAAQFLDHFFFRGLGFAAGILQWVQAWSAGGDWILSGQVILGAGLLGLIDGAILGVFQWAGLRLRLRRAGWWLLSTSLGMGLGMALFYALLGSLGAYVLPDQMSLDQVLWLGVVDRVLLGMVLGILQWLVLRNKLRGALWWIPWLMATMVTAWVLRYYLNLGAAMLSYSALTGLLLAMLPTTAREAEAHEAELLQAEIEAEAVQEPQPASDLPANGEETAHAPATESAEDQ